MSKLSWKVYRENFNAKVIEEYDIFAPKIRGENYFVNRAKEIKKRYPNKEDWIEAFRLELRYHFCMRSEHEVVITSWPPYINADEVDELKERIVAHNNTYNWSQAHIDVPLTVGWKVDIYDQLMLNKEVFFDYVWKNI